MLIMWLAGCAVRPPEPPPTPRPLPTQATTTMGVHVVQRGETLYRIAQRYRVEWRSLAQVNNITPPYIIYPGQRLQLSGTTLVMAPAPEAQTPAPTPTETAPSRPAPPASESRPTPRPGYAPEPSPSPSPSPPTPPPAETPPTPPTPPASTSSGSTTAGRWQWPAQGTVIRQFSNQTGVRRGIAISGARGDPVRAAADGEVVYAGSGLVGYGRLIILNHDARYLSAYGHNDELLVREGEQVKQGQIIAHLGDSGAERPMLHFEIRLDGTPVDPLRYLPRR